MPVGSTARSLLARINGKPLSVSAADTDKLRAAIASSPMMSGGRPTEVHPDTFPTWTELEASPELKPYSKAFSAYHWSPHSFDEPTLDRAGSVAGSRDGNGLYLAEVGPDVKRWMHTVMQSAARKGMTPEHPDWVPGVPPGAMPFGYKFNVHTPRAGLPLFDTPIYQQTPKLRKVFEGIGNEHGVIDDGLTPRDFGQALLEAGAPGGGFHASHSPLQRALLDRGIPGYQTRVDPEAFPDMPEIHDARVYTLFGDLPKFVEPVKRIPYAIAAPIAAGAAAGASQDERSYPPTTRNPSSF